MSEYIDEQPGASQPMGYKPSLVQSIKHKVTTKDGWLGDFDYGFLCMPQLPFGNNRHNRKPSPFYGLEDDMPILVMLVTGFQHALAMIAGLITPPIIFASSLNLDPDYQSYMISSSLIVSGILSCVQMSRFHLGKGYYLGTGLLTVVGTSFATLSISSSIFSALYSNGTCPTSIAADGTITRLACPDAYGALIGTTMATAWFEMLLAFVPPAKLRNIFPPCITGTVVILIGASLMSSSATPNWGGGSDLTAVGWGSATNLGLGFLSFVTIVIVEIFGSPFMRNASIILGLLMGSIVAAATGHADGSSITTSPAITFIWVKHFKLSVYAPAILPAIAVYIALALEATGDITASAEASRVATSGLEFDSRIQGGILADGVAGLVAGCMTITPMSIFAQNNGVISLTKCANRKAGYTCACFLILFGILGKIAGVFLSIPDPVLGGATAFLFSSVIASGVRVLSRMTWGRKERFVLTAIFAFGFGNLMVPTWWDSLFAGVKNPSSSLSGFFTAIIILLSTPYLSAFLVGVILWNIIPAEDDGLVHQPEAEAEESFSRVELGELNKGDGKPSAVRGDDESDDIKMAAESSSRVEPVRD